MEWLHDLHGDDMIALGSAALFSGLAFGVLARLCFAALRKEKTS